MYRATRVIAGFVSFRGFRIAEDEMSKDVGESGVGRDNSYTYRLGRQGV